MTHIFQKERIEVPHIQGPPILLLHLSDIHFRDPVYKVSTRKASARLIRAVERFVDSWPRAEGKGVALQAALVAGDVAYRNEPKDYKNAQGFLARLTRDLGLPGKRIYVVPGEHDIYLRYVKNVDNVFRLSDPVAWNGLLRRERLGLSREMEGRFFAYHRFLRDIGIKLGVRIPSASMDLFYADAFKVDNRSVGIMGLNSSWSCVCRLDEDRGLLCLGRYQVEDARKTAVRVNGGQPPDVCVALVHHPMEWVCPEDQESVTELSRCCQLVLRGHMHHGERRLLDKSEAPPSIGLADFLDGEPQPGFIIHALDPAAAMVHCWPFQWDGDKADFAPVGGKSSPASFEWGRTPR